MLLLLTASDECLARAIRMEIDILDLQRHKIPAEVRSSMNARIAFGSAGKYGSPLDSHLEDRPIRFLRPERIRRVSALRHGPPLSNAVSGPSSTGRGAIGLGSNSDRWLLSCILST